MRALGRPPAPLRFALVSFPTFVSVVVFALTLSGVRRSSAIDYAIVVHGGANSGGLSAELIEQRKAAMKRVVLKGKGILARGGTALDAVERVICDLEDDPLFNAGRGAVLNSQGGHELDASIMDGKSKGCGAVAGVTTVKNPISLARLVMTETRHVLLGGSGAEAFALEQNVARVKPSYFRTERAVAGWKRAVEREKGDKREERKKQGESSTDGDSTSASGQGAAYKGTVGCVALDRHGNLAAGTSTGGLTNKKFGRIGDSPIIGAGTYADNATCGVSCTGVGEQYIRNAAAFSVSAQMKYARRTLAESVRHTMRELLDKGDGGMIAIDRNGVIVMDFTTAGMARAAADSSGRLDVRLEEPSRLGAKAK